MLDEIKKTTDKQQRVLVTTLTKRLAEELAEYFVGKNPLLIEHHWQHVYRSAFFRGGNVLMSALSGIDQVTLTGGDHANVMIGVKPGTIPGINNAFSST